MYPNPAKRGQAIRINNLYSESEIRITNSIGRLILLIKNYHQGEYIATDMLTNGIYNLQIKQQKTTHSLKLVVL